MELTGEVEIVPGVIGPLEVAAGRGTGAAGADVMAVTPFGQEASFVLRFDVDRGRYACTEVTVRQGENGVPVTSESLRRVDVETWIVVRLLAGYNELFRDLPNPDGREPWGSRPPAGLAAEGPTDRVLRWVAHLYRLGLAFQYRPTKRVEEVLGLPRSTTGRWVSLARKKGYLEPAELGRPSQAARR